MKFNIQAFSKFYLVSKNAYFHCFFPFLNGSKDTFNNRHHIKEKIIDFLSDFSGSFLKKCSIEPVNKQTQILVEAGVE